MMTPQQLADKWAQRAGSAQGDYKSGVMGVTQAPGQLAVQAQATMVQKWNESINSGQWAARTGAVSLGSWQNITSTKGATNYTTGVAAAKPKVIAAATYYLPVAQAVKEAVKSIPRDGGAGSLARVQMNMEMFKQAKANRR